MLHPFVESKVYLRIYILTWFVIALVHGGLLYFKFGHSIYISVLDSLVFNFLFAIMGLSVWFIVAYDDIKNQTVYYTLFKQVLSGVIFVLIWVFLSTWVLNKVVLDDDYQYFLDQTVFWRYVLGGFYYIIVSIVFYLILNFENLNYELEQKNLFENMAVQSELKALKTQVNPHFLFNSLNSISYLTIGDGEKAQEMLVKLSDFMRYSLSKGDRQFVELKEELDNAHSYLDIEKIRFEDRIAFTEDVDKRLLSIKVPHLIIQPLLENAIKYGVYESEDPVNIRLKISKVDDFLVIKLENEFNTESKIHKGEGIGLENIKGRLNLLFNGIDLLKTEVEGNNFIVRIFIPINGKQN